MISTACCAKCKHAAAAIEEIGLEIEEPFGILPLENICAEVLRDLTDLINNQDVTMGAAEMEYEYPNESAVFKHQ
jgi:predicted membrane chloride channel (bestrophin family)